MRQLIISIFFGIFLLGCISPKIGVMKDDEILLSKKIYYSNDCMTDITNIKQFDLCTQPDSQIAIFDQRSIHILDTKTRTLIKKINFKIKHGILKPEMIMENCTDFKIISTGDTDDVAIMDQSGKIIWSYNPGEDLLLYGMAVADLNHDGDNEYYVATDKALYKFNSTGDKIWERPGWIRNVIAYDAKEDDNRFIVARLDNGQLQYYNSEGRLLRKTKATVKIMGLERCDWPSPGYFLSRHDSTIYILDINGKVVFNYKLDKFYDPTDYRIFDIRCTPIKFYKSQEKYLAVIACLSSMYDRSILCIFSPDKKLVYKEVLHRTRGLTAIPSDNSISEILLVGDGAGKVYSYQPIDQLEASSPTIK